MEVQLHMLLREIKNNYDTWQWRQFFKNASQKTIQQIAPMFTKAFNMKRQLPAGKLGQEYRKKVKVTREEKGGEVRTRIRVKKKNKVGLLSTFPEPAAFGPTHRNQLGGSGFVVDFFCSPPPTVHL